MQDTKNKENALETLMKKREEFNQIYEKFVDGTVTKENLAGIVREIESLQKQYDKDTEFSKAQLLIHDFYIKVPTESEQLGCVTTQTINTSLKEVGSIFNVIAPLAEIKVNYKVVGIASGSAAIVCDIFDKKTNIKLDDSEILELKEKYSTVLSNATLLVKDEHSTSAITAFKKNTGLTDEQAFEITKNIEKILDNKNDEYKSVEIGISSPDNKESKNLTIADSDRKIFLKNKATLYNRVKPDDILVLKGKLGIMEEWDENHKISIIDEETMRVFTINYDPTSENIQKIKDNIGAIVSIERRKDPDDNRKWILVKWL
jgi:hypothetical protein